MLTRAWNKLQRLVSSANKAHRESGLSRIHATKLLLNYFFKHRIDPEEAFVYGLLTPPFPDPTEFISKAELSSLQEAINPKELFLLTGDKGLFYRYCEGWGIAIPKLVGLFYKGAKGLFEGRVLSRRQEWVEALSTIHHSLAIKPMRGHHGLGFRAFIWNQDHWDHDGVSFSSEELIQWIDRQQGSFVIQEMVTCHPHIESLTACPVCQTVRVMTVLDATGPEILDIAAFKLTAPSNLVDNFYHGKTGNIAARIDAKTGMVTDAVSSMLPGGGFKHIGSHPVSGKRLIGYQVPEWHNILSLARDAAQKFAPLRTIGWDIAITADRVLMIEGNFRYDPTFFNLFGGGQAVRALMARQL